MFSDEMRPGRTFWRDDVFDITQTADGPFYNVPGYLDNFKVQAPYSCCFPLATSYPLLRSGTISRYVAPVAEQMPFEEH